MNYKVAMVFCILIANTNSFAEWRQEGENSQIIVYSNTEGIVKLNDTIRIWYLFDYKTPIISPIKFPYSSSREFIEFNCRLNTVQKLSFTWFEENMGQGGVLRNYDKASELRNVAPETFDSWLIKNACRKSNQKE